MADEWSRASGPQPVAVGPPPAPDDAAAARHRAEPHPSPAPHRRRIRRRRCWSSCVVAAVFLGSKLWHACSAGGNDYTGNGKHDLVIQVQAGDSTTAIGETLQKPRRGRAPCGRSSMPRTATRRSPRSSPASTGCAPKSRGQRRRAAGRPEQPGGQAGHPGRSSARRHHRHEDQRDDPGNPDADLPGHLCGSRRRQALRLGGRPAHGGGQRARRPRCGAALGR